MKTMDWSIPKCKVRHKKKTLLSHYTVMGKHLASSKSSQMTSPTFISSGGHHN